MCAKFCENQRQSVEEYGMTDYRSLRRRFYESYDPTNSVTALKDDG